MSEIMAYVVSKFDGCDEYVYNGEFLRAGGPNSGVFIFSPRTYMCEELDFSNFSSTVFCKKMDVFDNIDFAVQHDILDNMGHEDDECANYEMFGHVVRVSCDSLYATYYVLDAIEDVCLTKPQSEIKKMIGDLAEFVDNVTIDTNATDDTQVILVFF